MNIKNTLYSSFRSALIILKLVIPIYILADILYYYNVLSYVSFIIEPFTSMLGLPKEAALAIISGIFLNLYAAIAFAAPLDLNPQQWSVLAIFLGTCHSLIVEGIIMKKLGIANYYSYLLRFTAGLFIAYLSSKLPASFFEASLSTSVFEQTTYNTFNDLMLGSLYSSFILSLEIIVLITSLIFLMDYIKSRNFVKKSKKNISKSFSLGVGILLGITYGAGILINEAKNKSLNREDLFYVSNFLMICHAIIEDTMLFVIFGADFTVVIIIRLSFALFLSFILLKIYQYKNKTLVI